LKRNAIEAERGRRRSEREMVEIRPKGWESEELVILFYPYNLPFFVSVTLV